jgi:branched-subunit amino acid ABC-type transport system permease component
MPGALVASFLISEVISIGGLITSTEMAYVVAFVIFIATMFVRPEGILARRR